ncbi:hypothetical protein CLOM_g11324 [Closterium sp. NIES-68]|nr:hypothetical protein CLOM_g11324 [Closterium sp. NIES-68]
MATSLALRWRRPACDDGDDPHATTATTRTRRLRLDDPHATMATTRTRRLQRDDRRATMAMTVARRRQRPARDDADDAHATVPTTRTRVLLGVLLSGVLLLGVLLWGVLLLGVLLEGARAAATITAKSSHPLPIFNNCFPLMLAYSFHNCWLCSS